MSERNVRNVSEDYLKCGICLDQYESPRLLPCGHTFCLSCLSDHINHQSNNRGFNCPIDKKHIAIPWEFRRRNKNEWADAFPVDTFTCGMQDVVKTHENGATFCTQHPDKVLGYYCFTCEVKVCILCAAEIHRGDCDCVNFDVAAERLRPACDKIYNEMTTQLERAEELEGKVNDAAKQSQLSKDNALKTLQDLETDFESYVENARRQIAEFRKDIRKGRFYRPFGSESLVREIRSSMGCLNRKPDQLSSLDVIDNYQKYGSLVKTCEQRLNTLRIQIQPREVSFNVDQETERMLKNKPKLGSISVSGQLPCPRYMGRYRKLRLGERATQYRPGTKQNVNVSDSSVTLPPIPHEIRKSLS